MKRYQTSVLSHERATFHLRRALEHGVTRDQLIDLVTHLAFYAGWPAANTAVSIARKVLGEVDGQ